MACFCLLPTCLTCFPSPRQPQQQQQEQQQQQQQQQQCSCLLPGCEDCEALLRAPQPPPAVPAEGPDQKLTGKGISLGTRERQWVARVDEQCLGSTVCRSAVISFIARHARPSLAKLRLWILLEEGRLSYGPTFKELPTWKQNANGSRPWLSGLLQEHQAAKSTIAQTTVWSRGYDALVARLCGCSAKTVRICRNAETWSEPQARGRRSAASGTLVGGRCFLCACCVCCGSRSRES